MVKLEPYCSQPPGGDPASLLCIQLNESSRYASDVRKEIFPYLVRMQEKTVRLSETSWKCRRRSSGEISLDSALPVDTKRLALC